MRFAVLSEIPMYTLFKGLGDIAEIGKIRSDRTSVRCGGRAFLGGSEKIFCSKAERFAWLAEQILSMCGICVEFRLCSANMAELDRACSDRISVRWGGTALSGDPIGVLCSTVEHSDGRAEKIRSKYEICVGLCLCSADPAELDKADLDRTSARREERAFSGGPIGMFNSIAEDSAGSAE